MTSVNLGKPLKYIKIQENLRCENVADYYLCKGAFKHSGTYGTSGTRELGSLGSLGTQALAH